LVLTDKPEEAPDKHSSYARTTLAVRATFKLNEPVVWQPSLGSESTFYRWKKVYAGMGVSEIRRLKQLEDENAKLKRLVADLTLDKTMLQDALRRKW